MWPEWAREAGAGIVYPIALPAGPSGEDPAPPSSGALGGQPWLCRLWSAAAAIALCAAAYA